MTYRSARAVAALAMMGYLTRPRACAALMLAVNRVRPTDSLDGYGHDLGDEPVVRRPVACLAAALVTCS